MNCYRCDAPAGYAEPIPGKDTVRPVCALCRTAAAQPVEMADFAAAALFGASIPWSTDA